MTQDVINTSNNSKDFASIAPQVSRETVSMTTRDGVRLDADVYRPLDSQEQRIEPLPVLLMRQPYGRAIASTVVYAHPRWYAAQGYIVVIQDTRGRGTSEGRFKLFETEVEDGEDTVHWAANLPGSNGKVGMYGFSYQGMTQLYAASAKPEPLKALCPAMLAYDLYSDWAYEGGAFCLQPGMAWAIQLAAETARLRGDEAAYLELAGAARNLPVHGPVPSQPEILQRLAPDSFYHDWVGRSDPEDEYWRSLIPNLTDVDLPMLHIGGWFDFYLRGTLNLYQRVTEAASPLRMASPQHLWIGPWAHIPWNRKVGALDFGPEAASPIDRLQVQWFDQHLKGIDTGVLEQQPVNLFEMGSNVWRQFEQWPREATQRYRLRSDGLAAMRLDSGELIEVSQPEPNASAINDPADVNGDVLTETLVHDPWRPVPALGGHSGIPSGPFDRSGLDSRSDVLSYTTKPFETALSIAGSISLTVTVQADAPSFDLSAVLSMIRPQEKGGGAFNFAQGYRRIIQPGNQLGQVKIELQPTCISIQPGEALRLSLSAACFPAFAVNPGTGENPNVTRAIEHQIITLQFQLQDSIVTLSSRPS